MRLKHGKDPVMTAGASVEDVEADALAVIKGERSYRTRQAGDFQTKPGRNPEEPA
jgi:hypothetical protein